MLINHYKNIKNLHYLGFTLELTTTCVIKSTLRHMPYYVSGKFYYNKISNINFNILRNFIQVETALLRLLRIN